MLREANQHPDRSLQRVTGQSAQTDRAQRLALTGDRLLRTVYIVSLFIFISFALLYSVRRAPWNDEGWFANASLNLARHGFLGTTVVEPTGTHLPRPPYGIQQYTYWVLPGYLVVQAAWYKLIGFSLLRMRLPSVLFGLLGLIAFQSATRRLTGSLAVSYVAATLLALDTMYMNTSSLARMDIMAVALGWLAIAFYLRLREVNLTRAVAAGYGTLALACFTHHQAALAGIALLALTLYFDWARLRILHLLVAVLPFLALGLAWGLYGARHSDYFWAQLRANSSGRLGLFHAPLEALRAELIRRYGYVYGFEPGSNPARKLLAIVPGCYLLSMVWGLASSAVRKECRFLLILSVLWLQIGYQFWVEGMKLSLYLTHLIPWYTLVFSIWLVTLWHHRLAPKPFLAALVVAVVGVQVGASALVIRKNNYHAGFAAVRTLLEKQDGPSALIYGSPELGLEIGFDHLVDDLRLGFYTRKVPTVIVLDRRYQEWNLTFQKREPDVARYEAELLTNYDKVLDSKGYCVYLRH